MKTITRLMKLVFVLVALFAYEPALSAEDEYFQLDCDTQCFGSVETNDCEFALYPEWPEEWACYGSPYDPPGTIYIGPYTQDLCESWATGAGSHGLATYNGYFCDADEWVPPVHVFRGTFYCSYPVSSC